MAKSVNPTDWVSRNGQIVSYSGKEVRVIATFYTKETDSEERRAELKFALVACRMYRKVRDALVFLSIEQPTKSTIDTASAVLAQIQEEQNNSGVH